MPSEETRIAFVQNLVFTPQSRINWNFLQLAGLPSAMERPGTVSDNKITDDSFAWETKSEESDFNFPPWAFDNEPRNTETSEPHTKSLHEELAQLSSPSTADAVPSFEMNSHLSKVSPSAHAMERPSRVSDNKVTDDSFAWETKSEESDFEIPPWAFDNEPWNTETSEPHPQSLHEELAQISSPSTADAVLNFEMNSHLSKVGRLETGEKEKESAKEEPSGRVLSSVAYSWSSDLSRKTDSYGLASDRFQHEPPSFGASEPTEMKQSYEKTEEKSPGEKRQGKAASKKKENHQCDMCGKSFAFPYLLRNHKALHNDERLYHCRLCSAKFHTRKSLASHQWRHRTDKPHQCEVCGKGFTTRGHLTVHKGGHTGKKPYKCEVCGKSFTTQRYLIVHKKIHTGQKPHKCEVCGKGFIHRKDLIVHKRKHTGEKPHKCEVCGKGFTQRGHLIVHTRIHTGEKPFQCRTCGMNFRESGCLARHQKVHSDQIETVRVWNLFNPI